MGATTCTTVSRKRAVESSSSSSSSSSPSSLGAPSAETPTEESVSSTSTSSESTNTAAEILANEVFTVVIANNNEDDVTIGNIDVVLTLTGEGRAKILDTSLNDIDGDRRRAGHLVP